MLLLVVVVVIMIHVVRCFHRHCVVAAVVAVVVFRGNRGCSGSPRHDLLVLTLLCQCRKHTLSSRRTGREGASKRGRRVWCG